MQRKEFVQELTWWPCSRRLKHLSRAHLLNARLHSDYVGCEEDDITIDEEAKPDEIGHLSFPLG
jgi:hypothetical protein